MPNKIIVFFSLSLSVFCSCAHDKSEIRAVCERDATGNYLLKWETFPPIDGVVKIYETIDPDSFNLTSPIAEQDIAEGYKSVFSTPEAKRYYFKLVFNKESSIITAERLIPSEGVYNFRDVGGYYNNNKLQTRWGKLYRSSSMAHVTKNDLEMLNGLEIKTLIDLRTDEETYATPSKYRASQTFNVSLSSTSPFSLFDKVVSEEMKKGDIIVKLQDIQMELLHNNTDQFIKIFDILLNEKNYPSLVYCSLGKDRTGMVIALLLSALDVPSDQILQDYMLSNSYIEFNKVVPDADQYSPEVQEALTALFSSHEQVFNYLFDQIKKEYGSVSNYLEKELKLTNKKREKLKDLLLYQEVE